MEVQAAWSQDRCTPLHYGIEVYVKNTKVIEKPGLELAQFPATKTARKCPVAERPYDCFLQYHRWQHFNLFMTFPGVCLRVG